MVIKYDTTSITEEEAKEFNYSALVHTYYDYYLFYLIIVVCDVVVAVCHHSSRSNFLISSDAKVNVHQPCGILTITIS